VTEPHRYPRGAVVLVKLDPPKGQRRKAIRPFVIVTDAGAVRESRVPMLYGVVPLAGRSPAVVGRAAPRLRAREGGLPADAMALLFLIRTVGPERITGFVTQLNDAEMGKIEDGLKALFQIKNWVIPEDWRIDEVRRLLRSPKTDAELKREIAKLHGIEYKTPDDVPDDQP
jgi:mRNA-degrading endonuclease toxin of MazEF toxin-antitoxin module